MIIGDKIFISFIKYEFNEASSRLIEQLKLFKSPDSSVSAPVSQKPI